ncbi:RNA-directed DNA polymerase [Aliiroseovarius crassostreae]|uniref:RNA-directed DNA polymerase n=1 Tax=Aliiroseovarius crassostreae TaxID=154981 RepID=UPI003C7D150B
MSQFQLEEKLVRRTWKKLRDGPIPVVAPDEMAGLPSFVSRTNERVRSHSYIPEIVHGFLGLQKGHGVTRFLPILTKEDLAVYYQICGVIGDKVLIRRDRIYGGWHSVPTSQQIPKLSDERRNEENASSFQQNYLADSFSDFLWLKEFRSFTDLLRETTSNGKIGNYVVSTDIANFYDSIEVPLLIKRLRRDAPELDDYVSILEMFLTNWNRRTTGYHHSSKGIPQEIISDASRILSHYYLQSFDDKFDQYCLDNGLTYLRWADDIIVFGNSPKRLEEAVHKASKLLLSDGLNLNAPKTRIFSRLNFAKYRGLDVLAAIDVNKPEVFRRKLKSAIKWAESNPFRLDTVFRAAVGFVFNLGGLARTYEKNFILEVIDSDPDIIGTLNSTQLVRLIAISDDAKEMFLKIRTLVSSKPFAGPRANFLRLIRTKHTALRKHGISQKLLASSVDVIEGISDDSEIILRFCIPRTREVLSKIS